MARAVAQALGVVAAISCAAGIAVRDRSKLTAADDVAALQQLSRRSAPVPTDPAAPPSTPAAVLKDDPSLRRAADGQVLWPPPGGPGERYGAPPAPPLSFDGRGRALPVISDIVIPCVGGQTCYVKDSHGTAALPGPNIWAGHNAFVWHDNYGTHLNVRPLGGGCSGWASSEAWFKDSHGYGTYLFRIIGPLNTLDYQVTFGAFTWDDDCPGNCWFREIDIEISRWGVPTDPTGAQFVVQPYTRPGNIKRIPLSGAASEKGASSPTGGGGCNDDAGPLSFNGADVQRITCAMQWYAGMLRLYCFDGLWSTADLAAGGKKVLGAWQYWDPSKIPTPGNEKVHLNLWQANSGAPGYGRRVHVVVAGFEHTPGWVDLGAKYGQGSRRLAQSLLTSDQALHDAAAASLYAVAVNPSVPGPASMPPGVSSGDVGTPAGRAALAALLGRTSGGGPARALLEGDTSAGDDAVLLVNPQSPTLPPSAGPPGSDPLGELEALLRHTALGPTDRTRVVAVAALTGVADAAHDGDGLRSAALRDWLLRMPLLEGGGGTLGDRIGLPPPGSVAVPTPPAEAAAQQPLRARRRRLLQAAVSRLLLPAPLRRRMLLLTAAGPPVPPSPPSAAPRGAAAALPQPPGQGQRQSGLLYTVGRGNTFLAAHAAGLSKALPAEGGGGEITGAAAPGGAAGKPPARRGLAGSLPGIIGLTVASTLLAQLLLGTAIYGLKRGLTAAKSAGSGASSTGTGGGSGGGRPLSAVPPALVPTSSGAPGGVASTASSLLLDTARSAWPNALLRRMRRRLSGLPLAEAEAGAVKPPEGVVAGSPTTTETAAAAEQPASGISRPHELAAAHPRPRPPALSPAALVSSHRAPAAAGELATSGGGGSGGGGGTAPEEAVATKEAAERGGGGSSSGGFGHPPAGPPSRTEPRVAAPHVAASLAGEGVGEAGSGSLPSSSSTVSSYRPGSSSYSTSTAAGAPPPLPASPMTGTPSTGTPASGGGGGAGPPQPVLPVTQSSLAATGVPGVLPAEAAYTPGAPIGSLAPLSERLQSMKDAMMTTETTSAMTTAAQQPQQYQTLMGPAAGGPLSTPSVQQPVRPQGTGGNIGAHLQQYTRM